MKALTTIISTKFDHLFYHWYLVSIQICHSATEARGSILLIDWFSHWSAGPTTRLCYNRSITLIVMKKSVGGGFVRRSSLGLVGSHIQSRIFRSSTTTVTLQAATAIINSQAYRPTSYWVLGINRHFSLLMCCKIRSHPSILYPPCPVATDSPSPAVPPILRTAASTPPLCPITKDCTSPQPHHQSLWDHAIATFTLLELRVMPWLKPWLKHRRVWPVRSCT